MVCRVLNGGGGSGVDMVALKDMTYGIVGLGIMGGSIAKSIRANVLAVSDAAGKVFACNRSTQCLESAIDGGVIDRAFHIEEVDEMLSLCDMTFICLYPKATSLFLKAHERAFKSGAVVTDISGVKSVIEEGAMNMDRSDVDLVIGHPMAGGEKEGYVNSKSEYFVGHNYILVPRECNSAEHLAMMRELISAMGFTRIVETTVANHDRKIAFTSQLCHVIASALVKATDDENITEFGGGSFEDLTRIAMINAPLWTELFLSDSRYLLEHIDSFMDQMANIRSFIAKNDTEGLCNYLFDVRRRRIIMGAIVKSEGGK